MDNRLVQKAERLAQDLTCGNERDASNLLRSEFMYNPSEAMGIISMANQMKNPGSVENVVAGRNGTIGITDHRNPNFFDPVGRNPYINFQTVPFNNGYPIQQYPNQNYPHRNIPNQYFPNQYFPNQNFPQQNYPVQNYPVQNYPQQNYPVQSFPVNGCPVDNGAVNPGQVQYDNGTPPFVNQQPVIVENGGTNSAYNPAYNVAGGALGGFLGALLGSRLNRHNGYGYPVFVPQPYHRHR